MNVPPFPPHVVYNGGVTPRSKNLFSTTTRKRFRTNASVEDGRGAEHSQISTTEPFAVWKSLVCGGEMFPEDAVERRSVHARDAEGRDGSAVVHLVVEEDHVPKVHAGNLFKLFKVNSLGRGLLDDDAILDDGRDGEIFFYVHQLHAFKGPGGLVAGGGDSDSDVGIAGERRKNLPTVADHFDANSRIRTDVEAVVVERKRRSAGAPQVVHFGVPKATVEIENVEFRPGGHRTPKITRLHDPRTFFESTPSRSIESE